MKHVYKSIKTKAWNESKIKVNKWLQVEHLTVILNIQQQC